MFPVCWCCSIVDVRRDNRLLKNKRSDQSISISIWLSFMKLSRQCGTKRVVLVCTIWLWFTHQNRFFVILYFICSHNFNHLIYQPLLRPGDVGPCDVPKEVLGGGVCGLMEESTFAVLDMPPHCGTPRTRVPALSTPVSASTHQQKPVEPWHCRIVYLPAVMALIWVNRPLDFQISRIFLLLLWVIDHIRLAFLTKLLICELNLTGELTYWKRF